MKQSEITVVNSLLNCVKIVKLLTKRKLFDMWCDFKNKNKSEQNDTWVRLSGHSAHNSKNILGFLCLRIFLFQSLFFYILDTICIAALECLIFVVNVFILLRRQLFSGKTIIKKTKWLFFVPNESVANLYGMLCSYFIGEQGSLHINDKQHLFFYYVLYILCTFYLFWTWFLLCM